MISLFLETSTEKGCVAIMKKDALLFHQYLPMGHLHSQFLIPTIHQAMQCLQLSFDQLQYLTIGIGPGSYTGIRVSTMTIKSFAYALNIPVVPVCSLKCFIPQEIHDHDFASIIDAKIGGLYVCKGKMCQGEIEYLSSPQICSLNQFSTEIANTRFLVSPHPHLLKKKMESLPLSSSLIWSETSPDPRHIGKIALKMYKNGEAVSYQEVSPLYLQKIEAERNH